MRVAVFTDEDLDSTNGATTTLRALVSHAPSDLGVRLYTFSDLEVDEPRYRTIPSGLSIPIRTTRRELLRDEIDLVHMTSAGPAGLVGRFLARRLGLPLVGSLHEPVDRGQAIARAAYVRWAYGRCSRVLVPSRAAARLLAEGGWSERSIVWHRGVDTGLFSPERRLQHLRDDWHVSPRRPAILVAGRLAPEKGTNLIEPVSRLLHRQRIAHRFVILGSGPLLGALKERCPDAFFTGRIVQSEVPPVMASADVLLYPGGNAGGCSVLLEAQASGLPVVVATTGSARENMAPGRSGYVCRAGDVEEFAVRLGLLLVDPDRRLSMGEAARAYACGRSWESSLETVYAAYRECHAVDPAGSPRPSALTTPHHRSAGQR